VAWLWTDALAALLVEHDRVAPARVVGWVERPVAYRAGDAEGALDLARGLLGGEEAEPAGAGAVNSL
jgi:hypothetical protein